MRILLTNDDGYDAPGLQAFYLAASMLPDATIDVIAPSEVQSGKGHIVSGRFRFWKAQVAPIGEVTVVDGSPPDCVRAAVGLPGRPRPDCVLSGINRGSNLGVDIYNSGTVAAAREAGFLGIPAIAISYLVKPALPDDWDRATRAAASVIAALLLPAAPCPGGADATVFGQTLAALAEQPPAPSPEHQHTWWNVNLPRLPAGEPHQGVKLTSISRDPMALDYCVQTGPDGIEFCENLASYHHRPVSPDTDVAATFSDWISISRLTW